MKNILIFIVTILSFNAAAERNYISGVQKVTFRTGPGTDNKVLKMLETDSKVNLVEPGETWSKVEAQGGQEGYILNRFLTKEVPFVLKYKWQKAKFDKLKESTEKIKKQKSELAKQVAVLKSKLEIATQDLGSTKALYSELQVGSADYIGLKAKFESTTKSLNKQNIKVNSLESKISIYYIKWFLAGSGVLFLGWLIGLISRKKKSYSGLSL